MISIELTGCAYQPLSSYLKALGVLRLVSEQADANARALWSGTFFCLESTLDREALIEFFLSRYKPTPVLAPWNGGSGFYPKDRKAGIGTISGSADARFGEYRRAIAGAQAAVAYVGAQKGASKSEEDERRASILRICRNTLPDSCVEWLDAAIAISSDGSRAFAPILGTGGNEGRLDYTNNFMENLTKVLLGDEPKMPVESLLQHALFDAPTVGLQDISVGQYDPGRSGGFNQGQGISASTPANPWNMILTIEGAVAWAGGIYRKQGTSYRSFLCSPFTVRPSAVGYGSATDKDQVTARAEIWTPLWRNGTRYPELRALLREGRAAVDDRPAQTGLEFAEAAASLGVDRGIDGFVRYSLVKRRGDSYIALPAGRFAVDYRRDSDLVRQLSPLLERAEWAANGNQSEAPNSWPPLRRAVEEGMFNVLLLRDSPESLRDTAAAVGALHRWLLERGRTLVQGERLASEWVLRCVECSQTAAEARIAAGLAFLNHPDAGPLLQNLTATSSQHSWTGRDLAERMLSTLRRRAISGQDSERSPFRSPVCARPEDIVRFINGELDERLLEDLLFAFVLVKQPLLPYVRPEHAPWPVYCLLKQLFLPGPIERPEGDLRLKPDIAIPALLSGGRVREAAGIAVRRLRAAGLRPVPAEFDGGLDPRRLGAALLIPVTNLQHLRSFVLELEMADTAAK